MLVSLPAEWTDVVAPDPFVVVSAGRSSFHIADLVELSELVVELAARRSAGVKWTTPEWPRDYAVLSPQIQASQDHG